MIVATFTIHKAELGKHFTGINTEALGVACGVLKLNSLRLYTYLCSNKNNYTWNLNPVAYASWLQMDYNTQGRTVRKAITDGILDLKANNYIKALGEDRYEFYEIPYQEEKKQVKEVPELAVPPIVQTEFKF